MLPRAIALFPLLLSALPAQQLTAHYLDPGSPSCVWANTFGGVAHLDCLCAPVFNGGFQFGAVVLSFSLAPSPVPLPADLGIGALRVNPADVIMVAPLVSLGTGAMVHDLPLDPSWAPIEWYAQTVVVTTQGGLWALSESYRFTWQ